MDVAPSLSKKLHHVSASQVDLYLRCPRLWFFQYVLGKKFPPTPAMARGTDIHAHMEKWGKSGALPPPDDEWFALIKMGTAAMELEVSKREDLILEQKFDLPTFEGGPFWTGFIDALDPNGGTEETGTFQCRVHDYKTLSDFRYVKTPDEIRNNLQLLSYAKFCISEESSIERVAIGHVYLRTKKPARVLMPPPVVVARDWIEEKWAGYIEIVREMYDLALNAPQSALDVTPHTDACGAYGGCMFRGDCGMIPTFANLGKKENVTMSTFAEKLKARALNGSVNGQIVAPVVAPEYTDAIEATIAKCPDCEGRKYRKNPEGQFLMCKACEGKGILEFVAIISPDAAPRTNQPGDVVEAAPAKEKKPRKKTTIETIETKPPTKQEQIAETSAALNAELLKKRVSAPRKAPLKAPTIYIDTFVVKGSAPRPVPFEEWLAPIVELLSSEMGLPDYQCDFANKANGSLFAAIQATLDTLPEHLYVSSSHRAASTFLEAIIPHAKEVFRGVR